MTDASRQGLDRASSTTARWGDPEYVSLLKRTIAQGTSDDEFEIFMHTAKRLQLDPLARQIYANMRLDQREGRRVMSVQVSIDGFRSIADKTGERDGEDGPYWCGPDGIWKDVWTDPATPPTAAKITVFRKGHARGYTGIAAFSSYVVMMGSAPSEAWSRLPDAMIAKCAEAVALRKAFPAQLAGVYTPDEMGQAMNDNRRQQQQQQPAQQQRQERRHDRTERRARERQGRNEQQRLELDAATMADLMKTIADATTPTLMNALNRKIATLVTHQNDIARAAWRARGVAMGWIKPPTASGGDEKLARANDASTDEMYPPAAA